MILFYLKNPKFLATWLLLSFLGVFISAQISNFYTQKHIQENKFKASELSTSIKTNIEQIFNSNIQPIVGLTSIIKINPNINKELLLNYITEAIIQNKQIQYISIAPNSTISNVVPIGKHDHLIGKVVNQNNNINIYNGYFIESIKDPTSNNQLFIGHIPIFLDNNKQFWGTISVAIDAQVIFEKIERSKSNYVISVKEFNFNIPNNNEIYGSFNTHSFTELYQTIQISNTQWQLAISPKKSWDEQNNKVVLMNRIINTFTILYSALMFFYIYIYQNKRAKELRFYELFTHAPIGIGLINSQTNQIIEANLSLLNQLEFNSNELKDINFFDLTDPSDKKQENENIDSIQEKDTHCNYQKKIQKKDCSTLPVIASNISLENKSATPIICTFIQDISKEKHQELELIESNKNLLDKITLLESIKKIQSALLKYNSKKLDTTSILKTIKLCSKSELCIINLLENTYQLDDNNAFSLENTHNEIFKLQEIKTTLEEVKNKKCSQTISLQEDFYKDGIKHFLIIPILDNNNLISTIILGRKKTIFDFKLIQWLEPLFSSFTQVALNYNNNILEEQSKQELIDSKNQTIKSSEAKSEFLSVMSHEIRTSINGVMGMLNLLEKTQLNEEQKHKINAAISSSQSLLKVINDILDFSKIESNQIEIEKRAFKLEELILDTKTQFESISNKKGIKLNFNTSNLSNNFLIGDKNRIKQIISNLLSNAIKFTHKGEINVNIDSKKTAQGIKLHVGVQDTGIGIKKNEIEQLFNPFIQPAPIERKFGGTGLGLAICKKLCVLMDGNIWVTSKEDSGSCFQFFIHLQEDVSNLLKIEIPSEINIKEHKENINILLAEDNFVNQEVIIMTLKQLGLDSQVVENGQSAIEHLKTNNQYNLIFMDCQMPVKNGFEVTKEIRSGLCGEHYKHTKIIALTANAMEGDKEKCLKSGMDDYLTKPIIDVELERVLIEFIQNGYR